MEFKKKLRVRLSLAIVYIILGLLLMIVFNFTKTPNELLSTFGLAMTVVGIARLRNYLRITKSEETIKRQQILETDERNVSIMNKAKSASFNLYIILVGIAAIVLHLFEKTQVATILSYSVCLLALLYWISYFIINKKS